MSPFHENRRNCKCNKKTLAQILSYTNSYVYLFDIQKSETTTFFGFGSFKCFLQAFYLVFQTLKLDF